MDFSSVHNIHEAAVFAAVLEEAPNHTELLLDPDLLADAACIALNGLPARYIRHGIDFAFYQTEQECLDHATRIATAVAEAFEFLRQTREGHR